MPALRLLLQAAPTPKYAPAPWFLRWLETMPVYVVVCAGIIGFVGWLLKKPIEELVSKLLEQFVERIKRSSKEPASGTDLARKAQKAIVLEQTAERVRVETGCDHVSVYGCQNGEYLRSGEGIDKFVMQAEASRPGDPRYIDAERVVFANDIPRTVLALEKQPFLLLWRGCCDDWKVDKMMTERDYQTSLAIFLRRPKANPKPGDEEGVIGMYVLSWRATQLYRPDQAATLAASHKGRLIDEPMQEMLAAYARELSYAM